MICTLTKISRPDIPGGLRTDSVQGSTKEIPTLGKRFVMIAESLSGEGDVRYIDTSEVIVVEPIVDFIRPRNVIEFTTTTGSVYELVIDVGGE